MRAICVCVMIALTCTGCIRLNLNILGTTREIHIYQVGSPHGEIATYQTMEGYMEFEPNAPLIQGNASLIPKK